MNFELSTRGSRSLAYELSHGRQLHLYYSLIQGQPLSQSFSQFPSVRHCLYVSKGYNVAFEFVLVFMATLEKCCIPLTGTQNFSCVLAHCLPYHLLGRHKLTPKL